MSFESRKFMCFEKNTKLALSVALVDEEPLSIRVDGKPYLVIMRTPGNEKEHAAGLCLAEGLVDRIEDLASIGLCDGADTNVVTITLTKSRRLNISNLLERKSYISNTSCGICGKEIVNDMVTSIKPLNDNFLLKVSKVITSLSRLSEHQPLRRKTKATHCSAIHDKNSNLLSSAEDVGRHNALDKSIGSLFLKGTLNKAKIITLSSRISYELVQKAARARIPIVTAISRPTSLAVSLANKLNITLITLSPNNGLIVYCNDHRLYM